MVLSGATLPLSRIGEGSSSFLGISAMGEASTDGLGEEGTSSAIIVASSDTGGMFVVFVSGLGSGLPQQASTMRLNRTRFFFIKIQDLYLLVYSLRS